MSYRDPRAFLLGLTGVSLLRAYTDDGYPTDFVATRLAEARAILDAELPPPESPGAAIWEFER
ncbi:hypothetical protein [Dactylosporangium salmoneum]|uniref:Uncharacterized protein n=1 Tax=Dactylosporangium salmoneum TaxID=53361 RepID=A0ABP5TXL0_9ACTN